MQSQVHLQMNTSVCSLDSHSPDIEIWSVSIQQLRLWTAQGFWPLKYKDQPLVAKPIK